MSWIDVQSRPPAPTTISLYRGERLDREAAIRERGVFCRERPQPGGLPGKKLMSLLALPPEVILQCAAEHLYEHVRVGSGNSPLVSFSSNRALAEQYGLEDGTQERGILIRTNVTLVVGYSQSAYGAWLEGAFVDTRGRLWIRPQLYNRGADAIARPDVVQQVHHNGHRDSEYLLLGTLAPDEFEIEHVYAPRFHSSPESPPA